MQMQIQTDPRDQVAALIVSGPSGLYDLRIPLESGDPRYAAVVKARLPFADGYDVGYEFGDGSVNFSD